MNEIGKQTADLQGEMFRIFAQTVQDYAIFLVGIDGTITTWNDGAQRIKGWRAEEVVGQHYRLLYLPEDRDAGRPEENLRLAAEHGHHEEEGRRLRKDGSSFIAHVVITPVHDATGAIISFAKVTQDVTDAKRTQEQLRSSEERLRTLLDNLPDGAVYQMLQRPGEPRPRFTYLSAGIEPIFGISPEDAIADPAALYSIIHPEDAQQMLAAEAEAMQTKTRFDHQFRFRHRCGELRWAHCRSAPRPLPSGEILWEGVMLDVTHRKRAEEAQRETAAALEDALRVSEERLRRALTAARMVVWEFDPETKELLVLENAAQVFGLLPDDTLEHEDHGFSLVHPDDEANHRLLVERAVAQCGGYHTRLRMIRRDTGAVQWMEEWAQAVPDDSGKTQRLVGVLIDITDRVQSEAALVQQHAFTRAIADNASTAIFMIDAAGCVTFMNPAAQAMTGYELEEAQGRVLHDLVHHTRPDGSEFPAKDCIIGKTVFGPTRLHNHEDMFVRKDGTMFPVRCSATPLRAGEGEAVTGVVLEVVDITEAKQGEQARIESDERFRAIAEHSVTGIAEVDLTGRFLFVNDRHCELVGRTREELLSGLRMQDVTHRDDLPRNLPLLQRLVKDGQPFLIEKRYVRPDGSVVWANNSVSAVRGADGRIKSVIAVSVDVTDRRQAENELWEANRRKDEFLAMLAHELRNPLAPIRTGLDLLAVGDSQPEVVKAMQQQVVHLVRLVDDLLDVSRIIRGRVELRKESVDFTAVVQQAVDTIRPQIDDRRQRLTVSLPSSPVWVHADPVRLSQVVANLLHNASKYNEDGGKIAVTARQENGEAVVVVHDSGNGIDPDLMPHIFDLFTQAVRTIDRSQGGLGIGLTLVKSLVEMHGGIVSAHSDGPGRGSEFAVRLPIHERTVQPVLNNAVDQEKAKLRILIVDDNIDAAKLLGLLLEKRDGHQVFIAHDGPAALDAAVQHRPDVILLDIGLPRMDGYEVARRLRVQPEFDRTLVVALTGYGTDADRLKSRDAGCDEHLVKPPALDALRRVLSHRKLTFKKASADARRQSD